MADNIAVTPGTGATIAADDIGGVLHQRVKLSLGADGTANDASAGAGAVGTGTQRVTLASDDPAVTDLAAIEAELLAQGLVLDDLLTAAQDTSDVSVDLTASELHIGQVGAPVTWVDVTFTLDTSAYATGDVLADTQAMASAVRVAAGAGRVDSIIIIDEDDQGIALDVVFLSANNSIGTENAAVSISDASARDITGIVSVAAADYVDLGGVRVATLKNVGAMIKGATASTSAYVALIARGSPTYTASGLRARFAIAQA